MARPTLSLICDVGSLTNYGDGPAFTINRGSTAPALTGAVPDAGTLAVPLNNETRDLDPIYTGSPFYPNLIPGLGVVAQANVDEVDYPLFAGTADAWPQQYGTDGTDQVVDFRATDAVKKLNVDLTTQRPQEYTGQRIQAVVDDLGVSIDTDIAHGDTIVGPLQHGSVSAWSHLSDMIQAEWGEGIVDHNGLFVFRDRDAILTDTRSSESQATFVQSGGLNFKNPQMGSPQLVNRCSISYDDQGRIVRAQDATSIAAYGIAPLPLSIPFGGPSQARAYARWIVARYAQPIYTFSSITLIPESEPDPAVESALWVQALGRELGDLITVILDPFTLDGDGQPVPSGEPIERLCVIRGIQHDFSSFPWSTTFYLQDASWMADLFTLDVSELDGPDVLGM